MISFISFELCNRSTNIGATLFQPLHKVSKYIGFDLPILFDLLELNTAHYSKLISEGHYRGDEFTQCRETISEIQEAIQKKTELESPNPGHDFQY